MLGIGSRTRGTSCENKSYPGNAHMLRQAILEYLGKVEMEGNIFEDGLEEEQGEGAEEGNAGRYANTGEVGDGEGVSGDARASEKSGGGGKISVMKGLIVPHDGYIYSGATAAYGYKILKKLDQDKKSKVLLLGGNMERTFSGAIPLLFQCKRFPWEGGSLQAEGSPHPFLWRPPGVSGGSGWLGKQQTRPRPRPPPPDQTVSTWCDGKITQVSEHAYRGVDTGTSNDRPPSHEDLRT